MGYLVTFLLGILATISNQHQKHSEHDSETGAHKPENVRSVRFLFSEEDIKEYRRNQKEHSAIQKSLKRAAWLTFWAVLIYAGITLAIFWASKKSADAAKESADTAANAMVLQERPWVKIKHRIIEPLTFDSPGHMQPVAIMKIEDTLENTGPTIALNVLWWEEIIPIDPDHSTRTARARQSQWCDANRHPDPRNLTGYAMFPKDPLVETSTVGPLMEIVTKAAASSPIPGKVGFVLVGCVCYRSSFEPITNPTHQTRFIYYLGIPEKEGGIMPYIEPHGTATALRLIEFPDGFSAD